MRAGPPSLVVVGVDGRRGGWAVAVAGTDGHAEEIRSLSWRTVAGQDAAGFGAVLALAADHGAAAVGVDCPIGLPAGGGWRDCDLQAKRRLGIAQARVFLAPPREVLAAPDYATARVLARELLDGRGVSAQAYGIRRLVLAVDEALAARRDGRADGTPGGAGLPVLEVHPELSFMAMTGRAGALESKHDPAGRAARVAALGRRLRPGLALDAPDGDDHLDALAAAWSAARWVAGSAEVLGGTRDQRGLPMQIVV